MLEYIEGQVGVKDKMKILIIISDTLGFIFSWFEGAGAVANFCTIILFVLFVIGKLWILIRCKNLYVENFQYRSIKEEQEFDRQFLLGGQEAIEISSPEGIYDIKVYMILERNQNGKVVKKKLIPSEKEDNICHPLKLNRNEKVHIITELPCGAPLYQIVIVKYDYVKIISELGYNGKVGGLSLVNKKVKHGIRSFLYYLCK